jgi:hypothetical protein
MWISNDTELKKLSNDPSITDHDNTCNSTILRQIIQ